MRTTLDIDEDVLAAAKQIAVSKKSTAGRVISDLARRSLQPDPTIEEVRNGVPLLPRRPGARLVTLEDVNKLRDEEP